VLSSRLSLSNKVNYMLGVTQISVFLSFASYIQILILTVLIPTYFFITWCFSDRASWIDYTLITNLMHWLLFNNVLRHPPTTFPLQSVLTQAVYGQATKNSHREWQYHMLHVYNCILLKMSTWFSKHVEKNIILWINNNQCIKLVINI